VPALSAANVWSGPESRALHSLPGCAAVAFDECEGMHGATILTSFFFMRSGRFDASFLVSFSHQSILILPGFVGRTVLISHFSGRNSKRRSQCQNRIIRISLTIQQGLADILRSSATCSGNLFTAAAMRHGWLSTVLLGMSTAGRPSPPLELAA